MLEMPESTLVEATCGLGIVGRASSRYMALLSCRGSDSRGPGESFLQIIGGVGVCVRVEFCKWRHGARDEGRRSGVGYDEGLELR
jgi:hypothetical protein